MKYLKLLEEYAHERAKKRRHELFDRRSALSKKKQYDANSILKILQKQYPKEEFVIDNYYAGAKCVFLSTDYTSLLNYWNRDSYLYDDGLNKDFAKWLKSNGFKWHWRTEKEINGLDGIQIIPIDHEGLYWYYGSVDEPTKKILNIDKSYINKIIEIFKKYDYNVYEPEDIIENDRKGSDRNIVYLDEGGMTFRFNIMKYDVKNDDVKIENQIKKIINKYIQTITRHYRLIKTIWDYCETVADGPLWTMCGGGMQLQQFYGDDDGYICVQYLGIENDENDMNVLSISSQNPKVKNSKLKHLINNIDNNSKLPKDISKRIEDYMFRKNLKKYNI